MMDDKMKSAGHLTKAIEAITPKNIDDIIRQNRDIAVLNLATDEDIAELYFPITPGEPKDVINQWSLITLNIKEQIPQVMLVGDVDGTTVTRVTSTVQQIDLKNNVLITRSGSLYQLATRNDGKPAPYQLLAICAIFHRWGLGDFLGAPEIFY